MFWRVIVDSGIPGWFEWWRTGDCVCKGSVEFGLVARF